MVMAIALAASVVMTPHIHPRTPVLWPDDTPCMTVVDRSQSTVLHLAYEIPFEDLDVPPEEVPDSRRHQFVAFCRGHSPQEPLPTWLSWADVAAADAFGLVFEELGDQDVLETSDAWAPCFRRISPDDARRPITFAAAAEGVDWDTASLPAGPYVVEGYTWEPGYNLWRTRPGVVHVVDGPGLDVTPAAAVASDDEYMFAEQPLEIAGCVRAAAGATLSGSWALVGDGELEWREFVSGVPVAGDTFVLPFVAPPEALRETIALRVDVVDPAQRRFTAHMRTLVAVLLTPSPGCGGSNFIGDDCDGSSGGADPGGEDGGTTDGGTTDGGTTGASPGEPMMESGLGARGCSCGFGDAPASLGLLGFVALARRRRRRVGHSRTRGS